MLLKFGDNSSTVKQLQYALNILCCNPGTIDGNFGGGTETAVRKFQEIWGLTPIDGIVGDDTWNAICSEIKPLQAALAKKGYYNGGASGVAGESLFKAIKKLQSDYNVTADGMVGPTTRALIFSDDSGEGESDIFPMGVGSKGDYVRFVQCGLYILCCNPSGIDGSYGESTAAAVKKFQSKYGLTQNGICDMSTWSRMKDHILDIEEALDGRDYEVGIIDGIATTGVIEQIKVFQEKNYLNADGQVGPSTRELLFSNNPDGASDAFPLKRGSRGPNVLYLQYALRIMCINPNGTDGAFGAGTETGVNRYKASKNYTQDGKVDAQTWDTLCQDIEPVQRALRNLSYISGPLDGVATEAVYNAVVKYQTDNGLVADGMVGTTTRLKLLGGTDGKGTISSTLKLGSNGSLTLYLQRMLNALNYNVPKDGIFNESTKAAVISFQTLYSLDADGIVGGGTWRKLFEVYQINPTGSKLAKLLQVIKHELNWAFAEDNVNNITPYGQWYGMNGSSWCAMFVSYCAYQAGIMEDLIPRYSWCESGATWYRIRGRYHKQYSEYIPKIGDVIFYYNYDLGRIAHTGIVIDGDEKTVLVAEGNTTHDRVEVITRSFSSEDIDGYGDNFGTPIFEKKLSVRELAEKVQRDIHDIIGLPYGADIEYQEEYLHKITDNMKYIVGFSAGESVIEGTSITSFDIVNGEPALNFDLSDRVSLGFEGIDSADLGMEALAKLFSYTDTENGITNNFTCAIKAISRTIEGDIWIGFGYDIIRSFVYEGKDITLTNSYAFIIKKDISNALTEEELAISVQTAEIIEWCYNNPQEHEQVVTLLVGFSFSYVAGILVNSSGFLAGSIEFLDKVMNILTKAIQKIFSWL